MSQKTEYPIGANVRDSLGNEVITEVRICLESVRKTIHISTSKQSFAVGIVQELHDTQLQCIVGKTVIF